MAVFNEEFLSEREFEAVLATFSCYDNGFYVSEVVKRTATDQKDYHKCNSFCSFIHSFILVEFILTSNLNVWEFRVS